MFVVRYNFTTLRGCAAISCFVMLLSGCDNQSFELSVAENFEENRASFETLERKLAESGFDAVRYNGFRTEGQVGDDTANTTRIDDDPEWGLHMENANVAGVGVSAFSGEISFRVRFLDKYWDTKDGIAGTIEYIHNLDVHSDIPECQPEYRKSRDIGECKVVLDDDWLVYHTWFPFDYDGQ